MTDRHRFCYALDLISALIRQLVYKKGRYLCRTSLAASRLQRVRAHFMIPI